MCEEIIIIGASGHGKVIADIIEKSGDKVFGFIDDNYEKNYEKSHFLGTTKEIEKYVDKKFIIAIGNNDIRKKIFEKFKHLNYYRAIHPTAIIAHDVSIGAGSCVMANAVINSCTTVGRHCIINTGSIVEHDNKLGDYVHISPNATLCGTVSVAECSHIGGGAIVKNNVNITSSVVVGVGGVVISDLTMSGTYIGVPVKELC